MRRVAGSGRSRHRLVLSLGLLAALPGCGAEPRPTDQTVAQREPAPVKGLAWSVPDASDPYTNRFQGRDGEADARADRAAGLPPALFMGDHCGVVLSVKAIGLSACSRSRSLQEAGVARRPFPEASGGLCGGGAALRAKHGAYIAYARVYNQTMLDMNEAVRSACPDAAPTDDDGF